MRVLPDTKLDFDDVLLLPKRSTLTSRKEVDLIRTYTTRNSQRVVSGLFVFAANLDTCGSFAMADALAEHKMFTCLHKFYSNKELIEYFKTPRPYTFYTSGITDKDIDKLLTVNNKADIENICLDVANGYMESFETTVRKVRRMFPKAVIIAGNVCTKEVTEALILAGADFVKVGIGSGKLCRTRSIAGIGQPQLSSVFECADAAHGLDGHIISDGGVTCVGDIVKAFAGGADGVMLGSMFCGYDECEGDWIYNVDEKAPAWERVKVSLKCYGMSSKEAIEKHYGKMDKHRASEGACETIPYKGKVETFVQEIQGGLRSGCTYCGAKTLKALPKCATFVKIK